MGSDVLLADSDRAASTVVGSADYMSPEQAQGQPITAAGDLYQSGAILYFLLTGQPPYPRETQKDVLAAHASAPPPVPSALVPSASPLDRVVTRAMAKDPGRRYADAYAFQDAIRGALGSMALAGHGYQPTLVMAATPIPASRVTAMPTSRPPSSGAGVGRPSTGEAPMRASPPARPPVEPLEPERSPASAIAVVALVAVTLLAAGSAVTTSPTNAVPPASVSPSAPVSPSPTPSDGPSASPSHPVLVTVPKLYGDLADASTELGGLGLRIGSVTRVRSSAPADQIIEQSPDAGLRVAWGTRITVRVASGFNLVPNVAGLPYDQAVNALRAAGFVCTDAQEPTATILGSTPAADAEAAVGSTITLSWSPLAAGSPLPTPEPSDPSPSASGG